jgi:long-chain acyl-CoA synthetase
MFPIREGLELVTIPGLLERSAKCFGTKIALRLKRREAYQQWTYQDLSDQVARLSRGLVQKGLKAGDRIGLIGENRPEWVLSYFGILGMGGVVVPLDPELKSGEIQHILRHSGAISVIGSSHYLDELVEARAALHKPGFIISMEEDLTQFCALGDEFSGKLKPHELDDLAVLIYTSGTTGTSKGIMLSHRNIVSNVDALYRSFEFGSEDNFLSVLPLHHTFGATTTMLVPISAGAKITFLTSLKSKELIQTMRETGVTRLVTVPLMLEKICDGIERSVKLSNTFTRALYSSSRGIVGALRGISKFPAHLLFGKVRRELAMDRMKLIIAGGAALTPKVSRLLEDLGLPILQGYGLSEASPVVSVNPEDRPRNLSVGLPLPGVEVRIDAPGPEGIGEVMVRGPNVMLGYYENPAETERVLKAGWLYTGDLGRLDADGYLYICGRKKSIIVTRGGKNIYPEEVEMVLAESPYIKEVVVVTRPHPETQREELCALVYPDFERIDEDGAAKSQVEVEDLVRKEIRRLSAQLAEYKRPKHFKLQDEEFVKTTTQKIKRYLYEAPALKV